MADGYTLSFDPRFIKTHVDSVCPIEPNNLVSGQGKTENTGRHGSRTREGVRTGTSHGRVRFLLESIPGSQAIGRVALGDRSVHAQRVSHKGNILHGHSIACQGSGPSGHVGHLSGLQRHVSPCADPPRLTDIPVLPSRGQAL